MTKDGINCVEDRKKTSKEALTIKELAIDGMFIALTFLFTWIVNIKLPFLLSNGGLIHLGNVPLIIAAMVYGKRTGALAGAFGMGMFDIFSGWIAWAPCTFITVGLMGFFIGLIAMRKSMAYKLLAIGVATFVKIAGYYIFEAIIYKSYIVPLASIPGNVVQVLLAAVIALPIVNILTKIENKRGN